MNNASLAGNVALVTGASHGIGAAIAIRLAASGAKTVVNYLSNRQEAEAVVARIQEAGGEATAAKADVSEPDEVARLFDEAERIFGRVSLLVNNAAIRGTLTPASEIDVTQYEKIFRANVRGPLVCMVEFARRHRPGGGSIVSISSGQARTAMPGAALYSGTKGALEAITRVFAADLGPDGIRVNAVAPGATATQSFDKAIPDAVREKTVENTALGRLGKPEDIADVVAFLLSEDAHWVTGEVIDANGGLRRS